MDERVVVCGPNLMFGNDFHVHRKGCQDLRRGEYKAVLDSSNYGPFYPAGTPLGVIVSDIYADMLDEDPEVYDTYARTVTVYPCAREIVS